MQVLASASFERLVMKFELEQNEVEFLVNVLGELPTKSNAYLLVQKLTQQAQQQQPAQETADISK